jgi:hypothetical protein
MMYLDMGTLDPQTSISKHQKYKPTATTKRGIGKQHDLKSCSSNKAIKTNQKYKNSKQYISNTTCVCTEAEKSHYSKHLCNRREAMGVVSCNNTAQHSLELGLLRHSSCGM